MDTFTLQLITGVLIGIGAGYVGSFMVLRHMSLVGDALSHVALPGIALALIFHINPFIGAFSLLFLAVVGIWYLEKRTALPSETLVGIFFTTSLALGLLLTPEPELLEALFGNISKVSIYDAVSAIVIVSAICVVMYKLSDKLMLGIISKELSQSMRVPIDKINFIFMFMVALIVALGLKITGTLLMGSLVIIPAAAAKNISLNLSRYTLTSCLIGAIASLTGILVASHFSLQPGPIIVVVSGIIFLGTLLFKK